MKMFSDVRVCVLLWVTLLSVLPTACGGNQVAVAPTVVASPPVPTPTALQDVPKITSVNLNRIEVPRYESIELDIEIEAKYSNPYDMREVALDGVFSGPNGESMNVP